MKVQKELSLTLTNCQGINRETVEFCQLCQGTGWAPVPETNRVKRCQCRYEEIKNALLHDLLKNWPEYKNADFKAYQARNPQQQAAVELIRSNPTGSYFMHGNYGAGKTHLLVAQYRAMCLARIPCQLRTARQLVAELTQAELPKERDRETFISPVLRMVQESAQAHLFIDDIDKMDAARTDFRAEVLFDLLDTIKRRQLGVSITGNLPLVSKGGSGRDMRQVLTDQVVSRIYRVCTEVKL
ncbi:MAG: hypothetical protein WC322_04920 [Candidatus Paceibacterota bacterium]